ncbi:putative GTP-binding protein [Escherichia coli]|nr:putative GTP-binding protein [Escherichia coli]
MVIVGYRDILLELDLVLWLIKADDRALSVDEYFWRHILHRGHQRVESRSSTTRSE